ncbi:hypothetical protein K470DRAFT_255126 [Piedraia hortae CBS 480.64]|uniref:Uncharacterized protein n=1 Tax=Piedraia hortae CBS 480.64 TaxID=1314780 RepID=A0A6A7C7F4_9PEZI|nr:hypothetical protein K470DRAFT_255126 [Piedraia hortae CBS 480.64]
MPPTTLMVNKHTKLKKNQAFAPSPLRFSLPASPRTPTSKNLPETDKIAQYLTQTDIPLPEFKPLRTALQLPPPTASNIAKPSIDEEPSKQLFLEVLIPFNLIPGPANATLKGHIMYRGQLEGENFILAVSINTTEETITTSARIVKGEEVAGYIPLPQSRWAISLMRKGRFTWGISPTRGRLGVFFLRGICISFVFARTRFWRFWMVVVHGG